VVDSGISIRVVAQRTGLVMVKVAVGVKGRGEKIKGGEEKWHNENSGDLQRDANKPCVKPRRNT